MKIFKITEESTLKNIIILKVVKIFIILLLFHSFVRWMHYRDYTNMSVRHIEEKVSYDELKNPNPERRYYRKYDIIKTTHSNGFLLVKTTKEKIYKGMYSKKKCNCD